MRPPPIWPRKRAPSRCSTARNIWRGRTSQRCRKHIRDTIAAHGIRNALVTSIAPTGTISLFADNVSSGIEPVFAYSYTRKVLLADGTREEEAVSDYAYRKFRAMFGEEAPLPDYFVNAQTLSPDDHLAVQAAAQRHIDSSISKTINVPVDIDFEAFKDVYLKAYEMGCKGCTTYRPNAVTGSVLSTEAEAEPAASRCRNAAAYESADEPQSADGIAAAAAGPQQGREAASSI